MTQETKTQETEIEGIEYYVGSGNVFADLELPDPEELQLKAALSIELEAAIKKERLTKKQVALRLDVSKEELAHLLDHGFSEFSISQFVQFLRCLGHDVTLSATVRERAPEVKQAQKAEPDAVLA